MDDKVKTLKFWAGKSSSGADVFEELPVEELQNGSIRVLKSPGLVLDLANGDEVLFDERTGRFITQKRGGLVAVQLYLGSATEQDASKLARELSESVSATWDGLNSHQAVFSFPARAGFGTTENLLDDFVDLHAGAAWFYGNVYADDGVTPLDWWR